MTIRRRVPMMKFKYLYEPSIDLAEVPLGGLFSFGDKRIFMLVGRDPWKATLIRYTFIDRSLDRAVTWLYKRFNKR